MNFGPDCGNIFVVVVYYTCANAKLRGTVLQVKILWFASQPRKFYPPKNTHYTIILVGVQFFLTGSVHVHACIPREQ